MKFKHILGTITALILSVQGVIAQNVYGTVEVYTRPADAVVELDGYYQGRTPLVLENVPSGNHVFVVGKDGYDTLRFARFVPVDDTLKLDLKIDFMIPVIPFMEIDEKPMFGDSTETAFSRWIDEVKVYPDTCAVQGFEGSCIVCFIVGENGDVEDVSLLRPSSHDEFNQEALRVISISPDWVPGRHQGAPAKTYCTVQVYFKLKIDEEIE